MTRPIDSKSMVKYRTMLREQEGIGEADADQMVLEILLERSEREKQVAAVCFSLYFEGLIFPRLEPGRGTVWRDARFR